MSPYKVRVQLEDQVINSEITEASQDETVHTNAEATTEVAAEETHEAAQSAAATEDSTAPANLSAEEAHETAQPATEDAVITPTRAPRHYYTNVPDTSHDDFDWSVDKRNVAAYKDDERVKFDSLYGSTFKSIAESELLHGSIVGLTKTDAIINIGFKSDGLVSLNEFRDMPDVKIGDEIEVMVVEKEDRHGHLHLPQTRKGRARMAANRGLLQNRRSGYRYHYLQDQGRPYRGCIWPGNIPARFTD